MARKGRHRPKKEELSQEQLVAEHRRRCRGPEWWSRYSDTELDQMQQKGQRLMKSGYGAADPGYNEWLVSLWKQK